MDQALGAASPGGSGLPHHGHPNPTGGARSEVPSSRSSMVDSASEMSESDTDAMSLSGKGIKPRSLSF